MQSYLVLLSIDFEQILCAKYHKQNQMDIPIIHTSSTCSSFPFQFSKVV